MIEFTEYVPRGTSDDCSPLKILCKDIHHLLEHDFFKQLQRVSQSKTGSKILRIHQFSIIKNMFDDSHTLILEYNEGENWFVLGYVSGQIPEDFPRKAANREVFY